MTFGRSACLAGLIALGAWSVAACSSDSNPSTGSDSGTGGDGGGAGKGSGGGAGKGGATGGSGGATGGSAGKGGGSGAGGKGGGGGAGGTTVTDGGDPSITITSPAEGAAISQAGDPDVPVAFTVANFTLMPAGSPDAQCPLGTCGHVHLYVDGVGTTSPCNDKTVTPPKPYNNSGAASPINAGLDYCPPATIVGPHKITLEIHNNDHSAVKVGGVQVADSVNITFAFSDGGAPEGGAKDGG